MVSSVQTRTHVARLPSRIHLLFWCTAIPAHASPSSYVCTCFAVRSRNRRWLRSLNLQVVERTSKGVGYGLPADLQHVDARHGGRVVPGYPLRDTEAKEVATYCRLTGFPTTFFPTFATKQDPRTSIAQVSQGVCSAVCACAAWCMTRCTAQAWWHSCSRSSPPRFTTSCAPCSSCAPHHPCPALQLHPPYAHCALRTFAPSARTVPEHGVTVWCTA